jgi:hypothetical protein
MKTTPPNHSRRTSLVLSTSLLLAATAAQGSDTTFSAFFNNGTGASGDKNASVYNWAAAVGSTGTIVNSPSTVAGVSQGATNAIGVPVAFGATTAGFLFHVPSSGAPGASMLYRATLATSDALQDQPQGNWFRAGTDSLSGLTLGDISQLSVYSRPAKETTVMRFAILVSGVWYASATSYSHTLANLANFEHKVLNNPSAANWIPDVGVPGTSLDLDLSDNGTPAPLDPASVVTGYGWYSDTEALAGTDARVRIDSYEIRTLATPGAPAAPSDLAVSPATSATQLTLTWTDNSVNETGFKLERSPNGSTGWALITTVPANLTTYTNTGLTPATPYFYRLSATNADGDSAVSATTTGTTLDVAPAAPTTLTISPVTSATELTLNWADNSTNETGFQVERSATGSGGWSLISTTAANTVTYTNTGLSPSTPYFYRVRAVNGVGNSAYTNTANATTNAGGSSQFETWLGTFSLPPATHFTDDGDNDGLNNLLEFVLGGNPTTNDSPSVRPVVTSASGSDLVVTFKRSDVSELQPVAVKVQISADLATWNPSDDIIIGPISNAGPIGGTGASYTVTNISGMDTIVVTIPKAAAVRKFARVVATQ